MDWQAMVGPGRCPQCGGDIVAMRRDPRTRLREWFFDGIVWSWLSYRCGACGHGQGWVDSPGRAQGKRLSSVPYRAMVRYQYGRSLLVPVDLLVASSLGLASAWALVAALRGPRWWLVLGAALPPVTSLVSALRSSLDEAFPWTDPR